MHKLYNMALRAYANTSFDPEKRAARWCAGYDADVEKLAAAGIASDKLQRLATAWLAAMARIASPMIVGPARFPASRMEKLRQYERAHAERYLQFMENALRPRKEKLSPADELAAARQKLEKAVADHAKLKAMPAASRPWYALPYALRDIKAAQARIEVLEKRQAMPHAEQEFPDLGLKLVQDPEAQRFRLYFNAKPDAATIGKLKGAGLKWAPSVGAWQRQITGNASYAIKQLIKDLGA